MNNYVLRPDDFEDDDVEVSVAYSDVKLFVKRLDGTLRPMRSDEWELECLKLGLKPSESPVVSIVNPAQPMHVAFEQALAEINELCSGNGSAQYLNRVTFHELYEKVRLKAPPATVLFPEITYVQGQNVHLWIDEVKRWERGIIEGVDPLKQVYFAHALVTGITIPVPFDEIGRRLSPRH